MVLLLYPQDCIRAEGMSNAFRTLLILRISLSQNPPPARNRRPSIEMRTKESYTRIATEEVGVWLPGPDSPMLRLTKKADYGLMALKFLAEHPETPS